MLLAAVAPGSRIAGRPPVRAATASVDWCREHVGRGTARAVLCSAGNVNALTGAAVVRESARAAAEALDAGPDDAYLASTGDIGEPLGADAMGAAVGQAVESLARPECRSRGMRGIVDEHAGRSKKAPAQPTHRADFENSNSVQACRAAQVHTIHSQRGPAS